MISAELRSMLIPALITLVLILISAYLMKTKSLMTSSRRTFILCGIPGSGKTNLFHLLTTGKLPPLTVTTFEPTTAELALDDELKSKRTFQDIDVIDFPANEKLKNLYLFPFFKEKMHDLRGIIYMIDSTNFDSATCHKVAKEILQILNITEARPNGTDMLIFANKNDLFTSVKSTKIKELLEIEIAKIHDLNSRGLSKVNTETDDSGDADNVDLAVQNGKFKFQLLESNIDFADGNIFKNKYDKINDWLLEKIVN